MIPTDTMFREPSIEMMHDEELKHHLGFVKSDKRPEESDNYRNGT
jgi:hypothetical protein